MTNAAFDGFVETEEELGAAAQFDAFVEVPLDEATGLNELGEGRVLLVRLADDTHVHKALPHVRCGADIVNGHETAFVAKILLEDGAELTADELAYFIDA